MHTKLRVVLAVLFAAEVCSAQAVRQSDPGPRARSVAKDAQILLVHAGRQTIGFRPDRAYLVVRGHALTVEFRGTPGVMPRLLDPKDGGVSDASNAKVFYEDLWPGISLTYQTNLKEITESTYTLSPRTDVTNIRLRYNVPVSLEKNGTLLFKFSTGYFTESSPEAWQEINGKRIPVTAAFRMSGSEIGFQVGSYDPNYALTIDPTCRWLAAEPRPSQLEATQADPKQTHIPHRSTYKQKTKGSRYE